MHGSEGLEISLGIGLSLVPVSSLLILVILFSDSEIFNRVFKLAGLEQLLLVSDLVGFMFDIGVSESIPSLCCSKVIVLRNKDILGMFTSKFLFGEQLIS